MFLVITVAYLIFWGPLFLVTLFNWSWEWVDAKKSMAHEVKVLFSRENLRIKNKYIDTRWRCMWHSSTPLSTLCCSSSFTKDAGKQPWTCSAAISLLLRVNSKKIVNIQIDICLCVEKIFILLVQTRLQVSKYFQRTDFSPPATVRGSTWSKTLSQASRSNPTIRDLGVTCRWANY